MAKTYRKKDAGIKRGVARKAKKKADYTRLQVPSNSPYRDYDIFVTALLQDSLEVLATRILQKDKVIASTKDLMRVLLPLQHDDPEVIPYAEIAKSLVVTEADVHEHGWETTFNMAGYARDIGYGEAFEFKTIAVHIVPVERAVYCWLKDIDQPQGDPTCPTCAQPVTIH